MFFVCGTQFLKAHTCERIISEEKASVEQSDCRHRFCLLYPAYFNNDFKRKTKRTLKSFGQWKFEMLKHQFNNLHRSAEMLNDLCSLFSNAMMMDKSAKATGANQQDSDIFERLRNGETISAGDPQAFKMRDASYATKKLLVQMNASSDPAERRNLLGQITGSAIDETTAVFAPL